MPLKIVRNAITKMQVDAIVNTANSEPMFGDGVDTAVYMAAGVNELLAERKKIGYMNAGEVAITPGFRLPAKYIIHAVSPFYIGGQDGEENLLRACYHNSLYLALENGCKSIAFPLISTGSFCYPKEEGMRIALDEINAFLLKHEMLIYLVVFDSRATIIGQKLYPALEEYIDQNYVDDQNEIEYGDSALDLPESLEDVPFDDDEEWDLSEQVHASRREKMMAPRASIDRDVCKCVEVYIPSEERESALEERMRHLSDTFQEYLLYLIEMKGLSNAEVYKNAIVTKQLFSKIKLNKDYHPDKATAMRLCVGAKLNLDETKDLLARAGYALSPCDKRDVIFSFFIENKVFDMIEIDIALEEYGLPCFIE